MFLTLVYFTSYGIIAVAVSPNVQMAAVLSSTFYSLWCASPMPQAKHPLSPPCRLIPLLGPSDMSPECTEVQMLISATLCRFAAAGFVIARPVGCRALSVLRSLLLRSQAWIELVHADLLNALSLLFLAGHARLGRVAVLDR